MSKVTQPGIYRNITPTDYFGDLTPQRALSASGVKTLLTKTPAEFITPPKRSNAALRHGDICHQLALGKGRGYEVLDFPTWASKAAKEARDEAESKGLTPVLADKFAEAEKQADVMRAKIHQTLSSLNGGKLPKYETEIVMVWQEETTRGPIWCKLMADVWCEETGTVLDPKFTSRLGDGVFESHATAMGWDIQGAWYKRGAEVIHPHLQGRIRFINLCVAPDFPYVKRAREADEATRMSCLPEIERASEIFAKCLYEGDWPAYPDEIEKWTARSWTLGERMARAEAEEMEE